MKKWITCLIALALLPLFGCTDDKFEFLSDELIVPMALDVKSDHELFSISGIDETEYSNIQMPNGYNRFRFPNNKEEFLICTAIREEDQAHVVLQYDGNEWSELHASTIEVFYPTMVDDRTLVFMTEDTEKLSIIARDVKNNLNEILVSGQIDKKSRFEFNDNGELLYVLKDEAGYTVQIDSGNDTRSVSTGRYAMFVDDSRVLIYRDRSLHLLDLNEGSSNTVMKDVTLIESPVYSPKTGNIAFFELDNTTPLGGELEEFLSVTRFDGWKKYQVESFGLNRRHYDISGMTWIEKSQQK